MNGRNTKTLRKYLSLVPAYARRDAKRAATQAYRNCKSDQERREFWSGLEGMIEDFRRVGR